jgi:eukaryotic-like serine/threonine-protein kinase
VNTALETTAEALPNVGAGLDTHAGPTFVQDRLRLLGKTVFLLSFGFYLAINGLYIASGIPPWLQLTMQHNVWHLIASSVMGAVWALTRARLWPMRTLGAIDAASIVLAGVTLAMMAANPIPDPLMAGVMALSVTVLARAVLVPSTAKRTLVLSALSAVPLQIVALVFHTGRADPLAPTVEFLRIVPSISTLLWLVLAVTLSTVASRTIYGLRRQVKEAAEIGQYTLVDKIGSGGMGEVWRARHRMLIRPAAVKLIRPNAIGPAERELLLRRFEREAHATAGLKSPHTVQLYDFGVTDDGTLYYVMELLDGMDLDTMVDRFGPMPAERVIHLLHQVSASLDDAHRNGLVHRDIKPANIVVSRFGAAWDFVKVLDFGLVKLEGARASEADNIRLTADGSSSGTPAFMAPEVALGEQATDHRVDIYSLGCVAYWLVTGKLLFDGPSAVKVMVAHAHTPPPPPSSRTELPIPPELEALILDCLEKDPARRPASAEALQARLQAIPIATPWTRERAERWWSEHAPHMASARPVADVLLSQEARPVRVIRQARPT